MYDWTRRCTNDTLDTSAMPPMRYYRVQVTHNTRRGYEREEREGRDKGDIPKHTAHSDTMLLRKRKRGRAGGSAG